MFLAVAEGLPVASALDLGCGPGALAMALAKRGWNVTAIDFAETAIDRARATAQDKRITVNFQVADMAHWNPPRQYDLVVSAFAMPPKGAVRDRVFQLTRDSIAPNGRVVIAEWDTSMAEPWKMNTDDLAFIPEVLSALHGFEIERSETIEIKAHGGVARCVFVVAASPA